MSRRGSTQHALSTKHEIGLSPCCAVDQAEASSDRFLSELLNPHLVQKRWCFPKRREGDAHPVLGLGVLDARLHGGVIVLQLDHLEVA